MINQLSNKYQQTTAILLFIICFNAMILPTYALIKFKANSFSDYKKMMVSFNRNNEFHKTSLSSSLKNARKKNLIENKSQRNKKDFSRKNEPSIGGPSQPELSGFKSAGTNDMVNLFTGDFSYNIPLLDVGGYPVNIFYDGGLSMEQEASWVGLGWNINPGNINRNMRGIPDDFDGTEVLTQKQDMKPNITWGVNVGADLELIGIKDNPFSGSVGASLGVSFNNYLGPALDIGIKGNTGLSLASKADAEKSAPRLGGSLSINASSRTGVTFTPGLSLTANAFNTDKNASVGIGLRASTSYNSRIGIKALQLSEQMSFNFDTEREHFNMIPGQTKWTEGKSSMNANITSSSISFNKPSYVPMMRMSLTNSAFSGRFQLGGALFGVYPSFETEVYKQKSEVAFEDVMQTKPMVGYLYMQKAINNANAIMDFSRLNDNEVTPSTPIISAPQYSYDVFSIQGEGTGGSIRLYRNDEGYVRDNYTISKDKNISLGADVGIPGHYGGNFNVINTPSTIGEWNAGNKLRSAIGFTNTDKSSENAYFRNPGETSVLNSNQYDKIGGINLVRYKLGGTNTSPTIEPVLEQFSKAGVPGGIVPASVPMQERKKRTQVISFLTAKEALAVGLDRTIKNYDRVNVLNPQGVLNYQPIPRFDNITRLDHHISQINVTEANGQRYVYGIPVYNLLQEDFTFTVSNQENATDPDKVDFSENETSSLNLDKDGYLQTTKTPPYAYSYLLSGLLSPDYVDVNNDGITEDDLGNAVKFNYTKIDEPSKWRTPLVNGTKANFNAGKRTETKDDKGIVSYGERESWYLHSIESKTMIALFKLENRLDNKGSASEFTGINSTDNSSQRLQQIDLFSKADLKKNGIAGAKPIKTVHFEYTYDLCKGTPNNTTAGEGKLTLNKIYFTFNGQTRASKNQYVFSYGTTTAENPDYAFNASDRWGTYKPSTANPASVNNQDYPHNNLKNSDYPYGIQDENQKEVIDQNASAWLLKKILLPSGGQMEVTYESDDYAFVQNKRATDMMKVLGFGSSNTNITDQLFTINGNGIIENNYAFIQVPEACNSTLEVFQKYLNGLQQLSFKLGIYMPRGMEFLHSYATIVANDYGLYTADASHKTMWVRLNLVDGLSPLSLTAIEFLREQLPSQAYPGYDISNDPKLEQIGEMLKGWWDGVTAAFKDPVTHLRQQSFTQKVDVSKCFVRLNDPDGFKYGGGYRVKSIILKDNWKRMNDEQLYTSEYGQNYDYTTKEIFNGIDRTISSGVASYEPSLGGDENPFQTMVQVSNKVPLGPASYGAIEMPILDAFFPASSVGYSKVTVRSIKKGLQDPLKKSRSGIGKQVTEFYTAKDFPVYYTNTALDPGSDIQATSSSFGLFFYKFAFDSRALSQGFLVETNDMHGKMKSQASYPENDDRTPVNYTQNFYRNTGSNGLDEKFDFIYANQGGNISKGNMGIDVDLMTDTREFSVKSNSLEIQGQVDLFPVLLPFWLPFIWPVVGESENTYRAVTTTKVISYHSILDSVLVIDKGSQVSTKNLVFDAETGDVIINRTNNEFNQFIYTTSFPAWWAYSGMGPSYKNIDAVYTGVNFRDGKIISGNVPASIFESGDELYLISHGVSLSDACAQRVLNPDLATKLWAFDQNKDASSLTNTTPDYYFIDINGKLYSKNGVSFKIIRSGKRNVLNQSAGSVVSMASPIVNNKLKIDDNTQVINATASEFQEKWQTDYDIIPKKTYATTIIYSDQCHTVSVNNEYPDCNGEWSRNINPYMYGLLGNFRSYQNKIYYGNRNETNPLIQTNVAANGFLENFISYWNFNLSNNLIPDVANLKWVFNNQITRLNSQGLQIETKDALGIYTSAQYGFNKTLPVCITNNSPYAGMANASFEDEGYNQTINGSTFGNCAQDHIDFLGMQNSSIISTNGRNFKAHSGENVLEIYANSSAGKGIPVLTATNPGFNLPVQGTSKNFGVFNYSGNFFNVPSSTPWSCFKYKYCDGQQLGIIETRVDNTYMSSQFSLYAGEIWGPFDDPPNWGVSACAGEASYIKHFYFKANNTSAYHMDLEITNNTGKVQVIIKKSDDNLSQDFSTFPGIPYTPNYSYLTSVWYDAGSPPMGDNCLNHAFYNTKNTIPIDFNVCANDYYEFICLYTPNNHLIHDNPESSCLRPITISVKGLADISCYSTRTRIDDICNYSEPIPATSAMLNPAFTVQPSKKMVFSAWVKEECDNGTAGSPCTKLTYDKNNIQLDFFLPPPFIFQSNSFSPTGPIIEGWQRYESEFYVPSNALLMVIGFINNSANSIHFDDIRIHPSNANMKSYVYDPVNLRLTAKLDENNYATFYDYDEEGTLIRTKIETKEGIKTVSETRSAKQKNIFTIVE